MVLKYNEKEKNALDEKENKPNTIVFCPRCGKELQYFACGNSYEVYCPTENCIKRTVRGI